MLLSSGDSFPHLIQKRRSQLGFVTYLLNYLRISRYKNRTYTVTSCALFILIPFKETLNCWNYIVSVTGQWMNLKHGYHNSGISITSIEYKYSQAHTYLCFVITYYLPNSFGSESGPSSGRYTGTRKCIQTLW